MNIICYIDPWTPYNIFGGDNGSRNTGESLS